MKICLVLFLILFPLTTYAFSFSGNSLMSLLLPNIYANQKDLNYDGEVSVEELISYYCDLYGVDYTLAYTLAKFESNLKFQIINPVTGAGGFYQWLKSSWKSKCEPKYEERLDAADNIACALETIGESKYGIRHWTSDLATRRMLVREGFVICYPGVNNCELR